MSARVEAASVASRRQHMSERHLRSLEPMAPKRVPTTVRRCSVRPCAPLHPSRAGALPAPARRSALPCALLRPPRAGVPPSPACRSTRRAPAFRPPLRAAPLAPASRRRSAPLTGRDHSSLLHDELGRGRPPCSTRSSARSDPSCSARSSAGTTPPPSARISTRSASAAPLSSA